MFKKLKLDFHIRRELVDIEIIFYFIVLTLYAYSTVYDERPQNTQNQ